jgi:hypothetical protein
LSSTAKPLRCGSTGGIKESGNVEATTRLGLPVRLKSSGNGYSPGYPALLSGILTGLEDPGYPGEKIRAGRVR